MNFGKFNQNIGFLDSVKLTELTIGQVETVDIFPSPHIIAVECPKSGTLLHPILECYGVYLMGRLLRIMKVSLAHRPVRMEFLSHYCYSTLDE